MQKVIALLLLCLSASAHADPERRARVQKQLGGVLRWGADAAGGAPFVMGDPKQPDRVIGFEVELAEALAKRLGVTAQFVQFDWIHLIPGLDQRAFDVALNGLEVTPDRVAQVRLTRPYYVFQQQLVVRKEDPRIQTLDDCKGLLVGTLTGSAAETFMTRFGGIDIKGYDGQVEPFMDLERGRVDAVLVDWPIALYYGKPSPALRFVDSPSDKSYYAAALRKEDADLQAELDLALADITASGELRRIYERWHMWNDLQTELSMPISAIDIANLTRGAERLEPAGYLPLLFSGAAMTIFLSLTSFAVAMLIGLIICAARLYGPLPLRLVALGYIEFFRGIPLFLLLFFLYFGLGIPAMATAILGFGLNYAAYEAEIYRSSILGVPGGQWDAAAALGMPRPLTFRKVIFPQAIRTALAPMTNDFVALFKDTSVVSVIAVRELTKEYQILATSNPSIATYIELGAVTAALYLLMSIPLGHLSRRLETRWRSVV
jgi:polar amino acid transport system substrate-binding protein